MHKFLLSFTVLVALSCFVANVNGKELIREFRGSKSKTTAEFEVKAPWILDWRTTGDYPGSMAMQVDLISSPSGEYVGKVATTKWVDDGVKLFNESGRYRFQVNSSLINWTLRVEELTRQEADTYIPKNQDR
jgi:hypothetical protein